MRKRKNRLSESVYDSSHIIYLDEAKHIYGKGAKQLVIGAGRFGLKERYGAHFSVIMSDVKQADDLRILDFNGHPVFNRFHFSEMGEPIHHEPFCGIHRG